MQSYPASGAPPTGPKNYVFVDEHNRHKRLKVMRACEGCRRRKIKCDSATTNTWPCAACTRLKLHCVPPIGGLEGDAITNTTCGLVTPIDDPAEYQSNPRPSLSVPVPPPPNVPTESVSFSHGQSSALPDYGPFTAAYQKAPYGQLDETYNNHLYAAPPPFAQPANDPYTAAAATAQVYGPSSSNPDLHYPEPSSTTPIIERQTVEELTEHLGELKIPDNGIAPYIREENKDSQAAEVPIQEPEFKIAAFSTDAGSHIRIPPALMPSQEDALRYFQTFFRDVHPYAPVLCRKQFYYQWHRDKTSISPLVLEAVFACAGRMSDDPAKGAQWLALANKHEACFLDKPRLSTLQALLLLLKAREGAPKRGYYYRSWMTCKTVVTMAKDLELHEHFETHNAGESCGSEPVECLAKTRVWQTLLICETMVGGPQGRMDLGVDPNSVDVSTNPPCSDIDEFEKGISRQFAYFVRNTRNIRLITDVSHKLKKRKDWGLDQEFVSYNAAFNEWPNDLPSDLQVQMPPNGAMPELASHFIGNMHSHYHLGIVMLRRPQLSASQSFATDSAWKHHMTACYNSAKVLCRLQEAILANFDLTGLQCMQRGINFTIYAILTCVMLHMIALTSPDPEFNYDARDYFVRHMRILEKCISAWPMPETEAQINALRAAFSADLNRPFELKPSFPLGTPSDQSGPSPPQQPPPPPPPQQQQQQQHPHDQQRLLIRPSQPYLPQHMNSGQGSYLATPPVSAYSNDSKPPTPHFQQSYEIDQAGGYGGMQPTSTSYFPQASAPAPDVQWNPTPIIDQFTTAFAIPPSALAPPSSLYGSSPPGHMPNHAQAGFVSTNSPPYTTTATTASLYNQDQQQQQYYQQRQHQPHQQPPQTYADMNIAPQSQTSPTMYPSASAGEVLFVTPKQWQQSVASVLASGALKRRWDYEQQPPQQQ